MLKFFKCLFNLSKSSKIFGTSRFSYPFNISKYLKMEGHSMKTKSVSLDENLPKKIKFSDDFVNSEAIRTVGTMCGAWRPEEEDGGHVLVFKTRIPCMSPDPGDEKDLPENVDDFWIAKQQSSDDLQRIQIRNKRKEHNAYKLYVSQSKVGLFLDDQLWPEGIIFRRFVYFKTQRRKSENKDN